MEKSQRKTIKDNEDKENDGGKSRLKDWKNEEAQVMGQMVEGIEESLLRVG